MVYKTSPDLICTGPTMDQYRYMDGTLENRSTLTCADLKLMELVGIATSSIDELLKKRKLEC